MLLNYSFIPLLLHHFVTTVLVAVEVCLRTSAGLGNIESSLFLPLCVFPIDKMAICLFALTAGMLFYHSHRWRYDLYLCAAKVIETLPFFVTLTGQQSVSTNYACCFKNAVLSHPQRQV